MHSQNQLTIENKKANFNYKLVVFFTAGIVLSGTEIKSIRYGKAHLTDSFCIMIKNELWVRNMYIAKYSYGSFLNHDVLRDRKLLLKKKELEKIVRITKNVGFTIIPVQLFINNRGLAKLSFAAAKGKKTYDKRQDLKKKEDRKQIAKILLKRSQTSFSPHSI